MEEISIKAMQEHCDRLSENGRRLTVAWNGDDEEDCPYLSILVDGIVIEDPDPVEEHILSTVEEALGYGDMRENLCPTGVALYNRDTKCFTGIDHYTQMYYDGVQPCVIDICLTEELPFENIVINLKGDGKDPITASIQQIEAIVPKQDAFKMYLREFEEQFSHAITEYAKANKDIVAVDDRIVIQRKDFSVVAGRLCHTITRFSYQYKKGRTRGIKISLVGK